MVTYHGHLGQRSSHLVRYFQSIEGVPPLAEGLNPATWMLQISTPGMESNLGLDFAKEYQNSSLHRCGLHTAVGKSDRAPVLTGSWSPMCSAWCLSPPPPAQCFLFLPTGRMSS